MGKRWVEFFEGENNRLSMMRLTVFMSFFPSSFVIVSTKSDDGLGWYLAAYVLGYVGGKGADCFMKPRIPSEPANVTINQPEKVNVAS